MPQLVVAVLAPCQRHRFRHETQRQPNVDRREPDARVRVRWCCSSAGCLPRRIRCSRTMVSKLSCRTPKIAAVRAWPADPRLDSTNSRCRISSDWSVWPKRGNPSHGRLSGSSASAGRCCWLRRPVFFVFGIAVRQPPSCTARRWRIAPASLAGGPDLGRIGVYLVVATPSRCLSSLA